MIISNVAKLLKDRALPEIQSDKSVADACRVMCALDVRAVVVMQAGALLGVISERDVVRQCVCAGRHTAETPVTEAMTREPKTVEADADLAQALQIMAEGGFHHIPVLRGGEAVGLISSDDIPDEYRMLLERFREIRGG
jgi:CBS domain-containing protein